MAFSRRLDIIESDYGRRCGWFIERDGERIAALVDMRWEDMFWDSYRLEVLTSDPGKQAILYSREFWADLTGVAFRDRALGEVALRPLAAVNASETLTANGRVSMRWLWLPVHCEPWHWLALRLRRLWRAKHITGEAAGIIGQRGRLLDVFRRRNIIVWRGGWQHFDAPEKEGFFL